MEVEETSWKRRKPHEPHATLHLRLRAHPPALLSQPLRPTKPTPARSPDCHNVTPLDHAQAGEQHSTAKHPCDII